MNYKEISEIGSESYSEQKTWKTMRETGVVLRGLEMVGLSITLILKRQI